MANPHVEEHYDEAIRCKATVFVHDERWGGWVNRCLLKKGHRGYHRHPLDACEPVAFMAWTGTRTDGRDS